MPRLFVLLSLLLIPFGNWSFLSIPPNLIPAAPSNFVWMSSVCLYLIFNSKIIGIVRTSKVFKLSAFFIVIHAILSTSFSQFVVDWRYLISASILYTLTIIYLCSAGSSNAVVVLVNQYTIVSAIFVMCFYFNQVLFLNGNYLRFDGINMVYSLRNSGIFFSEPSHYCAFVTPPLAYCLSILFDPDLRLLSSTRKLYILLSLLTLVSIFLSSSLNGLIYILFSCFLVLMPNFLRAYNNASTMFKITKLNIFYLFLGFSVLIVSVLAILFDITIYSKFMSLFSRNLYDSSSGISANAVISNLQIAIASFLDHPFGSGLGSYSSVFAHYSRQLYESTTGARYYGITFLNSSDGASLFIRLLAELGIFIGIVLYYLFVSLKVYFLSASKPASSDMLGPSLLLSLCHLRAIYAFGLSLIFCYSFRTANLQSLPLCIGIIIIGRLISTLNWFRLSSRDPHMAM